MGVGDGARVAIVSPNSARFLVAFFGVSGFNRILVPINFRLTAPEIGYIVGHSGASALLVDPELEAAVAGVGVKHRIVLDGVQDAELFAEAGPGVEPHRREIDENETASINYTSGTTARPKGVQLTHRGLWLNAAIFGWHTGVGDRDVYLHTLPMFHANGWGGVWAITATGATHVCLRKVVPSTILDLFEDKKVSLLCGAPTVVNMLVNEPKAQEVKITTKPRMATAGSPPAAALIQRAQDLLGLNMMHVYGLTETSPFILYNEYVFEARNVELLSAALPEEERAAFGYDASYIDWWDYWINVHIPALRKWSYPIIEGRPVENTTKRTAQVQTPEQSVAAS